MKEKLIVLSKNKSCKYCNEPVVGRSDKIFCCIDCRTEYHNKNNRKLNQRVRKINAILRKNHKILIHLKRKGITQIKKESLVEEHFNFNYFTNVYQTKKGQMYYFVYDHGYLGVDKQIITIVKKGAYVR